MLNISCIMGRLTRDPEMRRTQSGVDVASFTLAVERDFSGKATGRKDVDFIDVLAWRQTAEFVSKWFKKGQMMAVEGRLQSREYTDKQGNKRKAWEIQADRCYFAGDAKGDGERIAASAAPPRNDNGGYDGYGGGPMRASAPTEPADRPAYADYAEMTDDDGDLPF